MSEGYPIDPDEQDPLRNVRSGPWLAAQTFPPLEWAVEGVIPEGSGLIVAPPKAGKSWLVFGVALDVASGGHAFGRIPTTQRPVLYLALEDGYRRLQARARTLLGEQPMPESIDFVIVAAAAEVPVIIARWLDEHRDEKPLVILDTLGKVLPPTAPGETPYARDYRVCGNLKKLSDDVPGSTLLLVHHTRKMSGEDFVDTVSGTQGIAGAVDFVLVLARRRQEDTAVLSVTGRDVIEAEYAVRTDDGRWTLDGAGLFDAAKNVIDRKATEGLGDRSVDALAYVNGRPVTRPSELADHLAIDNKIASNYLARLAEAGRVRKTARGQYEPLVKAVNVMNTEGAVVLPFTTPTAFTTTSHQGNEQ